jgi:hypothetical protein
MLQAVASALSLEGDVGIVGGALMPEAGDHSNEPEGEASGIHSREEYGVHLGIRSILELAVS